MKRRKAWALALALMVGACSGGGGGGSSAGSAGGGPSAGGGAGSLYATPAAVSLSVADVQQILAQAVAEAKARGKPATIAVTDRVGNVLAVYAMAGAPATASFAGPATDGADPDPQGLKPPAAAAAIAKAITGAYLSSGGNAFSTRTASMIVQQHFPPSPATTGLESGPLFGVQFSQLPCSDVAPRQSDAFIGPKRSPLGLAADPGGFPLYKNGTLVGGVGVLADGIYGFDTNVQDTDADVTDEAIAFAATVGFDAPAGIQADQVTVDGTTLRYSDVGRSGLKSDPASAPALSGLPPSTGAFVAAPGYYDGAGVHAGVVYGTEDSGIRRATAAEFSNSDAFVLTDGHGANRFPIQAGGDAADGTPQPLSAAEVTALLEEGFKVMSASRAQIRRPLDSRAQVSVAVADTRGAVLGLVRAPDAPVFGTDVAVQKARTAAFFSSAHAADDLTAVRDPDPATQRYLSSVVQNTRDFLGDPAALTGKTAFTARAIGNLARPFFPDGQDGQPNGPFSLPISQWSPFNTGLQFALIRSNLLQGDPPRACTGVVDARSGQNPLRNGIQIFPGSTPIYRNGVLVGAVGVSGDGIDQDDMISFLAVYNAGQRVGGIGEAPAAIRSDQIVVNRGAGGVRLRYVNCPFAPFLATNDQSVCEGK